MWGTTDFSQYFLLKLLPILQTLMKKGYELVSSGTENHLVLVNLKNKVRGETLILPFD